MLKRPTENNQDQPEDPPGIEFAPGVFADHVLRAQGWAWLEDYYGLPIATMRSQWAHQFGHDEAVPVYVALLLQRNRGMRDGEAFRLVRRIDKWDLIRQLLKLGSIGIDVGDIHTPRRAVQTKGET